MAVGLTAGLIVSLTGITGASVAFRHEIDHALNPALFKAPPAFVEAPVDRVLARAVEDRGGQATMVTFPREAGEAFVVDLADGREVFVDPAGERVLGERVADEALMAVVLRLHRTLLAGEAGKTVVGGASLALLLLVLSGLVLRVPRRGPARRRTARDWHELLGLWATVTLAISTITGATFAFKAQAIPAIAWLTRSEPVKPPKLPATEPVAMDTANAVASARRLYPDGRVMALRLPKEAGQPARVDLKRAGDPHPYGRTWVWVAPSDGRVLTTVAPETAPRVHWAYTILNYPLHTGELWGLPGRVAMGVSGLTPAVLFATGCWLFWKRNARRRRPAAPASMVAEPKEAVAPGV
jgi:uncharacterized iron-regulated membrane protein